MILAGAAVTAIGLFVIFCGLALPDRRPIASPVDERIRHYGVQAAPDVDDELQGSLLDRMVRPQMERLRVAAARSTPSGHHERLSRDLALAGNPLQLTATDFIVVRTALAVVGLGVGGAIGFVAGNPVLGALAAVVLAATTWIGLEVWLRSAVRARQQEVRNALPDAIDLMVVAMEAGMSFDAALARVIEKFKNPLTAELAKAQAEVDLGRSREDALEGFARRMGIDELSAFVQTVVTAGRMGVPLGDSLRMQADQLRWRRRDRARVKGAEAPIKMTIPMVLFIFPTLWIVLLGPSVLQIMSHGL